MPLFCVVKIVRMKSDVPMLRRFKELIPMVTFMTLSFLWGATSFFRDYGTIAFVALSLQFYLLNGKLVIACLAHSRVKPIQLEHIYLLAPLVLMILGKLGYIEVALEERLQFWAGIGILVLSIERTVTYTYKVVGKFTRFLGFGFFEAPKKLGEKAETTKKCVPEISEKVDASHKD